MRRLLKWGCLGTLGLVALDAVEQVQEKDQLPELGAEYV
jgi:hypothetical protein